MKDSSQRIPIAVMDVTREKRGFSGNRMARNLLLLSKEVLSGHFVTLPRKLEETIIH